MAGRSMLIWKIAATALVLCVFTIALKKEQPAFAFLASACGALLLLAFAADQLLPLVQWLDRLAEYGFSAGAGCLLRVLGIGIVSQLAADLCREAGLAAAASTVDLCGRLLALVQAAPLLQTLLDAFSGFLRG